MLIHVAIGVVKADKCPKGLSVTCTFADASPTIDTIEHGYQHLQLRWFLMISCDDGYIALSASVAEDPNQEADESFEPSSQPLLANTSQNSRAQCTPYGGFLKRHSNDESYTYAYGPKGIAGLRHNYYALLCAIFASIGGLTFGYDQGVIANVLVMKDFTERWPIGPWEKGLLTAVLELGALLGALFAGILADRYSRRHSIFLACVIFCVGSAFQCGAQSLTDLVLGRAIGGVGVGALSMLSPLYMAEISPPEVRGSLVALEQLAIVLGVVFGFWTGFSTRSLDGSASWRIPLGIQIIPGVLLAIGSLILPPSPRHLVLLGQYDAALRSLARLRLRSPEEAETDPLLQVELVEMRVEKELVRRSLRADANQGFMHAEARAWMRLFERKYVGRTLIGVLIMFFQQWSGINALLYYGPTLVQSVGLRGDKVTLVVSGGIGIVQFIAVLPTILYIDQWGRKPLLRVGSAIMGISHLVIALLVRNFEGDWPAHSIAAWTAVLCIYIFTAAYGMSLGPIGWVLPSEVFPLSMRSKGVALSTASNWINNFLIGLVTPAILETSPSTAFMIFATACVMAYFWSTYIVPETANVSLEEIDEVFSSSAGREDDMLKRRIEEELGLPDLIRRHWQVDSSSRL